MNNKKETYITAFALFALFFGAGNLLLPPLLGYNAGKEWFWVSVGFMITAVVIPLLGILAHARIQGTMFDFAKKVSPKFSLVYCILMYAIAIAIPSPRTAAATHEVAIYPFFETSTLLTSSVYFSLVLVFVLNRSKILNFIGKFLTPLIVCILLLIIGVGLFFGGSTMDSSQFETPIVAGVLEGYQTFDAIGAVVVGAVIIISLKLKGYSSFDDKKEIITKSGILAGLGLFVVYAGLISVGAFYGNEIQIDSNLSNDMQRATLLRGISKATLGSFGNSVFSVLIALACFTTAVGIVTGAADYFKGFFKDSQNVYIIVAVFACALGIVIGQLDFHSIVVIGFPVLLFIYPITIVLILLNILPEKYASKKVFRIVVAFTFLFSIPDVLNFLFQLSDQQTFAAASEKLNSLIHYIPLGNESLGWVLPALGTFVLMNLPVKNKQSK